MGKGYRLDKGFLLDYGWMPALNRLSAEQFKAVLTALVAYQQSGGEKELPDWGEDVLASCISEMILPQLQNRLKGAMRQAAGKGTEKEKEKESVASGETTARPAAAPHPGVEPTLAAPAPSSLSSGREQGKSVGDDWAFWQKNRRSLWDEVLSAEASEPQRRQSYGRR